MVARNDTSPAPTIGAAPQTGSPGGALIDSGRAWVAAVAVAAVNGIGFGTAYTFGTFFDAMAAEFGASAGATALIFAVTLLFFFGSGVVSGPIFDRVGPRPILAVGGTLFVAGLVATANADRLWVGVLTYGIGVGLGCGLYVAPLTALVGRLFVVRRTTALSIAAVGNGLGTLIMSPLSQRIIADQGWRQAYLTIAAIAAVIVVLSMVAVVNPPARPGAAPGAGAVPYRQIVGRALADRSFRSLLLASTLMSIALFVAFAFIVPFAVDAGVTSAGASRLVGVIGLSSVAGRLGLMQLADRTGPLRLLQITLVIQPLAYLVWLVADGRYVLLVVFAALLGTSYGGFVSVVSEAVIHLRGLEGIGTTMGLMFLSFGIGGLIGPPAAGYLSDQVEGETTLVILACVGLLGLALAASLPMGRASRLAHS